MCSQIKSINKRLLSILITFTTILSLEPISAIAANSVNLFYVSATGSGTQCTKASPCQTITQALNKVTDKAGGTIYVLPGEYPELLRISKSGADSQNYLNIIGISDAQGNKPLISPPGGHYAISNKNAWLVWLQNSFINFSGFEVAYSTASKGINLGGKAQHDNIVQNNKVHHIAGTGIWCEGNVYIGPPTVNTNCQITNNEVFYTVAAYCQYNTYASNPVCMAEFLPQSQYAVDGKQGKLPVSWYPVGRWGTAIMCSATRHCNIKNNTVYDSFGEGINVSSNSYGIISDNIIYDINRPQLYISNSAYNTVTSNLVYVSTEHQFYQSPSYYNGTPPSIELADDWLVPAPLPTASNPNFPDPYSGSQGLNGHNNSVYNNQVYGGYISLYGWLSVRNAGLKNSKVYNNTFVNAPISIFESGSTTSNGLYITVNHYNSSVTNNIFINGSKNPNLLSRSNPIKGIAFSNNSWDLTPQKYALYPELQGAGDTIGYSRINIQPPAPGTLTSAAFIPK